MAIDQFSYVDESGIERDQGHCVVAGYIGSLGTWKRFNRQWRNILARKEFGLVEFHAKEFFPHTGVYSNWPKDKWYRLLDALLDAIQTREIYPIGSGVDQDAFFNLTYGERCYMTGGHLIGTRWKLSGAPRRAYFVALSQLLGEAVKRTEEGAKVHFLFDEQEVLKGRVKEMINYITKRKMLLTERFGQRGHDSSAEWPGLQAADLYCYAWHARLSRERDTSDFTKAIEYALGRLNRRRRGLPVYNAAEFERILRTDQPPEFIARLQAIPEPPARRRR
jgi:hypothetical protein